MSKRVFITGASAVSPQPTFDRDDLEQVVAYNKHPLQVIMPDISGYVDPNRVRRMTRHTRMGLMAALNALKRAQVETPTAIIMGTGDGCKDSVAKFLDNMIDHDESVANPTAFIGSTHNSLAGQIAMATKSNGYNYTYLQRGLSFPSALLDGLLQVGEEGVRNVLVGAADVITDDFYVTHRRTGLWKNEQVDNLYVLQSTVHGALAGEGSAFFVLDSEYSKNSVELLGVDASFCPGEIDVEKRSTDLLSFAELNNDDVDLVFLGYNGDNVEDRIYDKVRALFPKATIACFKPLFGEFYTANALGVWMCWSAIRTGAIPKEITLQGRSSGGFKNALLYDHYQLKDHTLVLLGEGVGEKI